MKPRMEDAPRWAKFMAQDADGTWHLFENEPFAVEGKWYKRYDTDRMEYAHPHNIEWHETCEEIK